MSSFFRRPTDTSSSSDSDGDGSEDAENHSQDDGEDVLGHEATGADLGLTGTTESMSSQGASSAGDVQEDSSSQSGTASNVEHQRNILLASLLEDFFKTRASEMMNATLSENRFTRASPEVQPLARKLYEDATQTMAGGGFLPPAAIMDNPSNRQAKSTYLRGMETFAAQYGPNKELRDPRSRPQIQDNPDRLAVVRRGGHEVNPFVDLLQRSVAGISMAHHAAHNPSPFADMALSIPAPRRSHYESSFTQLRLLGRGGFGRVYHAYNVFDNKDYAVKKIPLSPRLSQRYRESGHKELNNVLREVQALAQLEHHNVVRYHATWIEEPKEQLPEHAYPSRKPSLMIGGRRLIADFAASSGSADAGVMPVVEDVSDGIVFRSDSVSHASGRPAGSNANYNDDDDNNDEQHDHQHHPQHHPHRQATWSANNVVTMQETTDARTSDIFTDGHARPNAPQDAIAEDLESVYVLHVQMSVYPMTLAQYLAPAAAPSSARSGPANPSSSRRHCFHLVPALRLLMGILCGLQYIHARGMVHRDIKPSNIFLAVPALGATTTTHSLAADGFYDVGSCSGCAGGVPHHVNPRIGDFGLVAELARHDDDGGGGTDARHDKAVGTEYYRPPPAFSDGPRAQRRAHSPDAKLDVFALGVILVEMLWRCATSTERLHVLRDLQRGAVPEGLRAQIDAEGHEAGTGESVVRCILGMIARDPRRRWGCEAVKDAIEAILARCRDGVVTTIVGLPPAVSPDSGEVVAGSASEHIVGRPDADVVGARLRKVTSIDVDDDGDEGEDLAVDVPVQVSRRITTLGDDTAS